MQVIAGLTWIIFWLFVFSLVCDFVKIVLIDGKSLKDFNKICGDKYK